jgi:hypothetical protein
MPPNTPGERLAALERGLSDHEARCEERLADIKHTVGETQAAIARLQWWIVGLVVAIAGWSVSTVAGLVVKHVVA